MNKPEVKKMIVETFEEDYVKAVEYFKKTREKDNGHSRIYNYYFEITEKMYGYVIGVIDLYYQMTDTLRCYASDEFYPLYNEYREKIWNKCEHYMELNMELKKETE